MGHYLRFLQVKNFMLLYKCPFMNVLKKIFLSGEMNYFFIRRWKESTGMIFTS